MSVAAMMRCVSLACRMVASACGLADWKAEVAAVDVVMVFPSSCRPVIGRRAKKNRSVLLPCVKLGVL